MMNTTLSDKVMQLVSQLEAMAVRLKRQPDLRLHRMVSEFYYLQKAEELKLLYQRLTETEQQLERLQVLMESHYHEIYSCLLKDLNRMKQVDEWLR